MAKKIPCELWVGTSTRFFKWGNFDSVADTKKYVSECITCYHEIRKKTIQIDVLKNDKSIKQYFCVPNEKQKMFETATDYAGGLWNGKDTFTVKVEDLNIKSTNNLEIRN